MAMSPDKITIDGIEITCDRQYRKVRIPRLEFEYGRLTLVMPPGYAEEKKLIGQHKRWIANRARSFREISDISARLEIPREKDEESFRLFVESSVRAFSKELGVAQPRVAYRKLESRWGSCNSSGKITVNSVLRLLPEEFTGYILYHEVAHMIERRHNRRFYSIVEKRFGNRKDMDRLLSAYWYAIKRNGRNKNEKKNG